MVTAYGFPTIETKQSTKDDSSIHKDIALGKGRVRTDTRVHKYFI